MRIPIIKIRRPHDSLKFITEIIPKKTVFILRRGPNLNGKLIYKEIYPFIYKFHMDGITYACSKLNADLAH